MTARSIVCGSCSADVPYGRLSCPSCGELLASVVGGGRRGTVVESPEDTATSALAPTDVPAAAAVGGERVLPSVLHDALDAAVAQPASAWAPPPIASAPPIASLPPIVDAPSPPGAYVPAMAASVYLPSPASGGVSIPAGPAAPARAWAGHGASSTRDVATSSEVIVAVRPAGDAERLAEFVGWLAVAGGALVAGGFLLPWGASVIGARGVGYLDRWGLAGPFHLLVALAVVVVIVLALVRNPVPTWIRIGVAGVILGTLSIGLTWPYLFGLPGTGAGALAVAIGAALLLAAGLTCLVTDRHERTVPRV